MAAQLLSKAIFLYGEESFCLHSVNVQRQQKHLITIAILRDAGAYEILAC
jgi:hypothetical protein